jgi:NAD(P)-dependent dehydrogenase (short-subunit alcohol dehydrogenase family)
MMQERSQEVAVVTGANRGLGLEVCRQLARRGMHVLLTSRDPKRGRRAVEQLAGEGLRLEFFPLDVTDGSSIDALARHLRTGPGRLDVLVNNAGVFLDPGGREASVFAAELDTIRRSIETNTLGPFRLCQALVPLMSAGGRIVNVSTGMAQLSDMNGGYPGYRFSKTALNALTRILADELREAGIKVNSVCPGWVRTDMGGPNATRSVSEGADTIVWAASLAEDGPSGGFFRDRRPIPW